MDLESDIGPWRKKCLLNDAPQKPYTLNNFNHFLPDLRKKRTPQQKVVDFMLTDLFSKQSIFALVDILFKDMKEDYKMIENYNPDDHEHEGEDNSHQSDSDNGPDVADADEDSSDEDADKVEAYMNLKGTLTIERIKDVVGEIMGSCKNLKYEILNKIMRGVIFEQKRLRESFMQEILKA